MVCIPKEDAKIIFKDLKKGEICDSIRIQQKELIQNIKTQIKGYKRETEILINKNTELTKSLNTANKKVRILGFSVKFGIPIGAIGGFALATMINK